jgi:ferredoxin-NADP reductase
MKAAVGISLGLLFVGLATFNVITILESSRAGRAPRTRARAIALHRAGGYLFIGLFVMMFWFMSKRLMGSPEGLSGDAVVHIALAILLAPLLFVKVLIARRYKNHHAMLLPLGLFIYAISVVLVFIRALPYALGLIHPSSAMAKYSIVPLVLFCAFLARLALRPAGPSASALSPSSSLPPSLPLVKPRAETFSLELTSVEAQTHDAKTLRFRLPEGRHLRAKPGQFLTFHLNIDGDQVIRSYSICSSPLKTDHVEITPKRTENGYVSVFLNERAKPGLVVNASGPSGQFYFDEERHPEIVLIAGGSGITPMVAMLRYLEDRALSTPVTVIYCVRTPQDIIFQQELTRLSDSLDHFRYVVTVSTPDVSRKGSKGRLSKALLQEQIPDFRTPTFFLCGPKPFMQLAVELLKEQGVAADRIKQESFGGKSGVAIPRAVGNASPGTVEFLRSGLSCGVNADMTLLELAETMGVSIPYSCRQGQCGTCATRLVRGNVTMQAEDGLSIEQKQAGFILPCVSKVNHSIGIDA